MGFYIAWYDAIKNGLDTSKYVDTFLKSEAETNDIFCMGRESDLAKLYEIFAKTPILFCFSRICEIGINCTLTSSDIPCFSTFENGSIRLLELLEFAPDGLTFEEIGYQLKKSIRKGACNKYGENHAKLASMMGLVTISNTRPAIVRSTSWGQYLVKFSYEEKADILKMLLLRDKYIGDLVRKAILEKVNYRETVKFLSDSTAYRRRSSVKSLVEFIFIGTGKENYLENIIW